MAAKIRKGDRVQVLTGRDKGKRGEVLAVMPDGEACPGAGRERGEASPEAARA